MDTRARPRSIRATARIFGVARDALSRAAHSGELPAFKIGRRRVLLFDHDVEEWIRSQPGPRLNPVAAMARAREILLAVVEFFGPLSGPVTDEQQELSRVLDALDDAIAKIGGRVRL
jgi:excisionase family DNA binding protein